MFLHALTHRFRVSSPPTDEKTEAGFTAEEGVEVLKRIARQARRSPLREKPCRPNELDTAVGLHQAHATAGRVADSRALHLAVLAPTLSFDVWRQISDEVGDVPSALIATCYAASSEDGRATIMEHHAQALRLAPARNQTHCRDSLFPVDGAAGGLHWRDELLLDLTKPAPPVRRILSQCPDDDILALLALKTDFHTAAEHISLNLWRSPSFQRKALQINGAALSFLTNAGANFAFLEKHHLLETALRAYPEGIRFVSLPSAPDDATLEKLMRLIERQPDVFRWLPLAYRMQYEVAKCAVFHRVENFEMLDPCFRYDSEFISEISKADGSILEFIDQDFLRTSFLTPILQINGSALEALERHPIYIPDQNPLITAALPTYPRAALCYDADSEESRQALRKGLEKDGSLFEFLSPIDQCSIDLARIAAKTFPGIQDHIFPRWLRDQRLIEALVTVDGLALGKTSKKNAASESIAMNAVIQNPESYKFVKEPARSSLPIMRLVSKTWKDAKDHLPPPAFSDKICLAYLLRFDGAALRRAPSELRNHPGWIARACITTPGYLDAIPESLRKTLQSG